MTRKKSKKRQAPLSGWAIYLRTSDEEAQNPESSRERQRYIIQRAVLERSDLPVIAEYVDVITGRTPHRVAYQQMLEDARLGKFSHVVVERADRFGRNDTEALRAIDELDSFGVAVRFANHPDLDPMSPDDRIVVGMSFTLARRESMMISLRTKGATEAKRQRGGYVGREPDGYISVEDHAPHRKTYAKKTHHIEPDPERAHIWRLAWDLLLTDEYTLAQICEELHARGYRYRSGRPFMEVNANGKRKANSNMLSYAFHNWTYAGWVVSEEAGIAPKTLRGDWEPIVTTEEFERGLEILEQRNRLKTKSSRREYILASLLYLSASPNDPLQPGEKLYSLTASTSNTRRPGGGTAHYRLERYPVHFLCADLEQKVADYLSGVRVDEALLPSIREYYMNEVANHLGRLLPDERGALERTLKQIDEEEALVLRLYAQGLVTEQQWQNLWAEWQDRRLQLRNSLYQLDTSSDEYIADLDDALTLIANLGVRYEKLTRGDKKLLLRQMIERVVVTHDGNIARFAHRSAAGSRTRKYKQATHKSPVREIS